MATLFNNPHVALFLNQMILGVMDKLEIDETNADEWFVEYQGDPERHLLHAVDAIIGFLGKPLQEFSVTEISKFLDYLQHMLKEGNCTIDASHLAELYKQVQDKCKGEAEAWKQILLKAEKDGNDSIDEAFIQSLWETIPENQGSLYKLHLAFKKMADDLELRSQVIRISGENTTLSHRAQKISSLLGCDPKDAAEIINMPVLDFVLQIEAYAKEKIDYLAKL